MDKDKDIVVSGRQSNKIARLMAELIGDYARVYAVGDQVDFTEDDEVAIWKAGYHLISTIEMEDHWPDTAMRVFSVVRNNNLDGSQDIPTRRGNSPIGAINIQPD